jgi:predicted ArsR family transcriptional regulator
MKAKLVWRGQHGSVILGPTEDRVARYLHDLTRHGLVTIRTIELAQRLDLERSEAYRVLGRLRALGLFGVSNDQGGQRGGRRIWRTERAGTASGLDAGRHRIAWARVVAWSAHRRARVVAAVHMRRAASRAGVDTATTAGAGLSPGSAPAVGSLAEQLRRHGAGALLDGWGIT